MSLSFIRTRRRPDARYSYCTRSTRLGASWECVKKCATLRLSKTYISNKIFPWARDWLPWKRRSFVFFAYIHFQWAHCPWSQRNLRVQKNASIAQNLSFRKLIEMRSNNYQIENMMLKSFFSIKSIRTCKSGASRNFWKIERLNKTTKTLHWTWLLFAQFFLKKQTNSHLF